ncbi:hypothetical protein AwDysgo_21560 [Bacteroidales bacterium]|nr:hypothetical protein AwDysgo_21560 [Bacteroidales bacterium]
MKKYIKALCVLALILTYSISASSQSQNTTQGKDFWLAFGNNYDNGPSLQIRIVAPQATTVTLNFTSGNPVSFSLASGEVYTYVLSATQFQQASTVTSRQSNNSIHITSTQNISVFAISLQAHTTDATNVLPTNALGYFYHHMSYQNLDGEGDGFLVVASQDGTTVYKGNSSSPSAILNKGQVYAEYLRGGDMTSLKIRANKPVAYFVANGCVNIPAGTFYCDCLFQQQAPIEAWGNSFVVPVTSGYARNADRVRIVAAEEGTILSIEGSSNPGTHNLAAGGMLEIEINSPGCYISSNYPISVAAYLIGSARWYDANSVGDRWGDPAMAWVPSIEQTVAEVTIAAFKTGGTSSVIRTHRALVMTPTATRGNTDIKVGGITLGGGISWTESFGGFSYGSIDLTNLDATYSFVNPAGLTVLGYGLGNDESYYYLAASSARQLNPGFYVNDKHHQDMNGDTYCNDLMRFRAALNGPLDIGNPGHIKWFVNEVEVVSARDQMEWQSSSLDTDIPLLVKLEVRGTNGVTHQVGTIFTLVDPVPPVLTASITEVCREGVQAIFNANSNLGSNIQWYKNGTLIPGAIGNVYAATSSGNYTATVSNGYCTTPQSSPLTYSVNPGINTLYWNRFAFNNNWNDPVNWIDVNGVVQHTLPTECSDVHIPGNSLNFPDLDPSMTPRGFFGNPICRNITFHFRSQLGQQHLLAYEKAYVQYNFGYYNASGVYKRDGDAISAIALARGRWMPISTPLKKIASGDFSLGGFPNFWQKAFKASPTGNNFIGEFYTPSNNMATDIGTEQYYAINIWAGELLPGVRGESSAYHQNLNFVKGIMQMPYFEDPSNNLYRAHTYSGGSSHFSYYNANEDMYPILSSKPADNFPRAGEAYRFAADGIMQDVSIAGQTHTALKINVPSGVEMMIGNPFMAKFDFDKLYELNSSKIEPYYRVYSAYNFDVYSIPTGSPYLTKWILPQEAIFIGVSPGGSSKELICPPALMTGTSNYIVKSTGDDSRKDDVLYISAENAKGESWLTISMQAQKYKNILKMFSGKQNPETGEKIPPLAPDVYAYDSDTKDKNAVQFEGSLGHISHFDVSNEINGEKIILSFVNIERTNTNSLELVDNHLKKTINLLEESTYEFDYVAEASYRFSLKAGKSTTSIASVDGKFIIQMKGKTLEVSASSDISEIEIRNTAGMPLYNQGVINDSRFSQELSLPTGIYLVSVQLNNGEMKTEKIIVK